MLRKTIIGILLVIFLVGNILALRLPEVPPERWIILKGAIMDYEATQVALKIMELDQKDGDIRIYIYSQGGYVKPALMIIDAIKTAKNDIQAVGMGQVSSMAVYIFVSCTKGKRALFEHSEFYVHEIGYEDTGIENLTDVQKREIEKFQKILNQILVDRAGLKIECIEKIRGEILSSEKAIKIGIGDGVYKGEFKKEDYNVYENGTFKRGGKK